MGIVQQKINKILEKKNLSCYRLSKLIDFSEGALGLMINGKSPFSKTAIEKIIPILEVSKEEFEGWILADKYSKQTLEQALKLKQEKSPDDNKLIRTSKIDNILQSKNMSRTALSKAINYSQGGLNEMIIGKEPLSKGVIKKISAFFEISENEIRACILADKYSLQILEMAFNVARHPEERNEV